MSGPSGLFRLDGRVVMITGGAGLLGEMHAEAVAEAGGIPVLIDIRGEAAIELAKRLVERYQVPALGLKADVTNRSSLEAVVRESVARLGRLDVLINNAANDPKVKS